MSYFLITCEDEPHGVPYVEALKAFGVPAEAIRVITPVSPATTLTPESCHHLGARAAGIVLGGGPDVEPWRFGEAPLPGASLSLLPQLDEIEFAVLAGARENAVPIWGICRGLQVLNVFFGGTLYQDLAMQMPGITAHQLSYPRDALIHTVRVRGRETPLGDVLGRETPLVNSRHHQAARVVAREMEVVATSPDGVVEAAVHRGDGWWIQAVQWHPENLLPLAQQRALWQQFIDEVEVQSPGVLHAETALVGGPAR